MTKRTQALEYLKRWELEHTRLTELMDGLEIGMGHIHPENKIFQTTWNLFDLYTKTLQVAIGDKGDWLTWYASENEMGWKGMAAGYDGKLKPIKTLSDLWRLIQESSKRG